MSAIATSEKKDVKPRFVYWGMNSRAQMSMLMLRSMNVDYVWDKRLLILGQIQKKKCHLDNFQFFSIII